MAQLRLTHQCILHGVGSSFLSHPHVQLQATSSLSAREAESRAPKGTVSHARGSSDHQSLTQVFEVSAHTEPQHTEVTGRLEASV